MFQTGLWTSGHCESFKKKLHISSSIEEAAASSSWLWWWKTAWSFFSVCLPLWVGGLMNLFLPPLHPSPQKVPPAFAHLLSNSSPRKTSGSQISDLSKDTYEDTLGWRKRAGDVKASTHWPLPWCGWTTSSFRSRTVSWWSILNTYIKSINISAFIY